MVATSKKRAIRLILHFPAHFTPRSLSFSVGVFLTLFDLNRGRPKEEATRIFASGGRIEGIIIILTIFRFYYQSIVGLVGIVFMAETVFSMNLF